MVDQYRVSRDEESRITFDPNVRGSAGHIVNLILKVVRASVESTHMIATLPDWDAG
jgi:predicted helicase